MHDDFFKILYPVSTIYLNNRHRKLNFLTNPLPLWEGTIEEFLCLFFGSTGTFAIPEQFCYNCKTLKEHIIYEDLGR